jgi:hypothetical protein
MRTNDNGKRCCWCDAVAVATIDSEGWLDDACTSHVAMFATPRGIVNYLIER